MAGDVMASAAAAMILAAAVFVWPRGRAVPDPGRARSDLVDFDEGLATTPAGRSEAGLSERARGEATRGVATRGVATRGVATRGVATRGEAAYPAGAGGTGRRARDRLDESQVSAALELLALVLTSGGGLVDAVALVAATSQATVRRDLTVVATAVRWGMPWPVAWAAVADIWSPARRALEVADAAGVAPSGALRRAAADLRASQLQRLDVATARLGVAIVLPLGLAFLPAFVLLTVLPLVLALAGEVWG